MRKTLKLSNKDIFCLVLLFLFSVAYFLRLFIPKESLFITPDVYSSDLVHINYSVKFILSDFLKHNQLPYWDWNIGNGFPLIGESQIGAFYAMNVILFKMLPFNFAFNLGYILTFYITSLGCYLFFRRFINNKTLVFLSSLIFTYSAPMFVQISHYNLLQTYSLIPLIFYVLEIYCSSKLLKNKILSFAILGLLLSQQFFAGYVMTTFMTLIFIMCYMAARSVIYRRERLTVIIKRIIIFMVGLGLYVLALSANQLIPLIEFAVHSVRNTGGTYASTANSLNPFIFLTYLKFDYFHAFDTAYKTIANVSKFAEYRNIFWDGNLYIGIFPFIASLILSIIYIKKKPVLFILTLFFIALLFALGQNSPLNFLYGLPPFSFFRTPFRFTIFMTFFTVFIFSITLDLLSKHFSQSAGKRKILQIFIFIFAIYTIINLAISSFKYHKQVSVEQFKKNEILNSIVTLDNSTIYSFGNELIWYQTLIYKKWFDEQIYLFFMKDLSSYINELYHISSSNIFFASFFSPKQQFYFDNFIRLKLIDQLMKKDINFTFDPTVDYQQFLIKMYDQSFEFPIEALNALRIKGVKFFISPLNIKDKDTIKKIKEISTLYDGRRYYIRVYEIANPYPRFYFAHTYAQINTPGDAQRLLGLRQRSLPTFGYSAININKVSDNKYMFGNFSQSANQIQFSVETSNPELLVSTVSYYPGIKVFIDGNNSKVEEVNFNQIAVQINKGKHSIKIIYLPDWLMLSFLISFLSHTIAFVCIGTILYQKYREINA